MRSLQIEQVEDFIKKEIEIMGYTLVDMELKGGRKLYLNLILDKKGGITLDECSSFNRKIVSWLEAEDIDAGNYIIDVCSPGLDREIKSDSSFLWALGKVVQVFTQEQVEGKNVVKGKLIGRTQEGDIEVEMEDSKKVSVKRNNINKVKLVPQI